MQISGWLAFSLLIFFCFFSFISFLFRKPLTICFAVCFYRLSFSRPSSPPFREEVGVGFFFVYCPACYAGSMSILPDAIRRSPLPPLRGGLGWGCHTNAIRKPNLMDSLSGCAFSSFSAVRLRSARMSFSSAAICSWSASCCR